MKITVFGIGYVGLVQAAVFAEVGHNVCCVDVDQRKIENLKKGIIPIYEPGLTDLVIKNHSEGRLTFTTDAEVGVHHADIQFIAVGTPPSEDGSADLKYVLAVAETIAHRMDRPKIVINKSTVPVGTASKVEECFRNILKSRGKQTIHFNVVSNPEFLKEGVAVNDCIRPNRIIIGTDSEFVRNQMKELYAPFSRNHEKIVFMDVRSAELTKYAANCMLATKISFMNEMSNIAEMVGADIEHVRKGIGSDERIGYHFIYPGCGYGGSCFPKDVSALIQSAEKVGVPSRILQSVEAVNADQKRKIPLLIKKHFGPDLKGKVFALWGLAFKPNTNDMREAPSRIVIEEITKAGGQVRAFDPVAMHEAREIYGPDNDKLLLCSSKEETLDGADALVICTEWQAFKAPDFQNIKSSLKNAVIFDGRNMYNPSQMLDMGFTYYGIGRGHSVQNFGKENLT